MANEELDAELLLEESFALNEFLAENGDIILSGDLCVAEINVIFEDGRILNFPLDEDLPKWVE